LYAHSCDGEFRAFAADTGKVVWGFNFEDFGVKFLGSKAREGTASRRGNNGSAIVDGDAVIVPVGATNGASLVCLNKNTGKLIWKTGEDEAAYSSPMVGNLAGARQVIAYTAEAILGADRITGKILWRVPLRTNAKRHTATPLVFGNNVIVNSHTFGTICFEISQRGSEFQAKEKWRNADLKINIATPVIVGDHIYSHGPARDFICASLADGKKTWSAPGFGKENSATVASGKDLLVLTDSGELVIGEADPSGYKEKARWQICGKNWNYPALAEGMLLVRDQRELAAYAVR
jgi:outer membrane protein assembly factor BamB